MKLKGATTEPYPRIRRLMADGGRLGREKHLVHGLYEMDVTAARQAIRRYRVQTGSGLSLNAYMIACVGRAVERHRYMQACYSGRRKIVIFDDVDVNTMFEVEENGQKLIRPHILRAVNRKTPAELHEEIRAFQQNPGGGEQRAIEWFVRLPGCLRRAILRAMFRNPARLRQLNGTVSLSSVGMFGQGGGWGIPVSNATLQITLGGIVKRPALIEGALVERQYLCVTVSVNHDLVDGAPAARFAQALKEIVESAEVLNSPNH
jgi:pyruvate/2-oxoglutarate dehydrogenase complex dihydrolipoamide acyltransferase (E2) component